MTQVVSIEDSDNFCRVFVKFLVGNTGLLKYLEIKDLKDSAMAIFKIVRSRFLSAPQTGHLSDPPDQQTDPVPQAVSTPTCRLQSSLTCN